MHDNYFAPHYIQLYTAKTRRNVKNITPKGTKYLGPRSSAEHSLRFRDSALPGSDEFSPTPLILNAYQRLENEHKEAQKKSFTFERNASALQA